MIVLIRGGGDLASGVALRLHRVGFKIVISELAQPLVVRRKVSFAEAIYAGETSVEGVTACKVDEPGDAQRALEVLSKGQIPVLVDPEGIWGAALHPLAIIDARMTKRPLELLPYRAPFYIGLGPGFIAGENCDVVIETNRGHGMGRVIWHGAAEADTGDPEQTAGQGKTRVLRAPAEGELIAHAEIGDRLEAGQLIAEVGGQPVTAPFKGALRGLLHGGILVQQGMKIGDIDPRDDPRFCTLVSDKALAVGGGVLEAILSRPELRRLAWEE